MKKIIILIFFAISLQVHSQVQISLIEQPAIDKRIELLSIVFRLAGSQEYSSKQFKLYTDRIEQHFEQHKDHELIQFTKSIIKERSLGYDAVASMSIYLDEHLNLLKGVRPLMEASNRWKKDDIEKFVLLLQRFYKDVDFDKFFNDNAELYAEAIRRFSPIYKQIDLKWYHDFYGKDPTETFSIILGVGNGGNNYGPSLDYINNDRKVYAIMGLWSVDNEGMPVFTVNQYFPILIHEFCHSFANYLIEKNNDAFRESGEKIFQVVKSKMERQAYPSWETMLKEALVRASVIKYLKDHDFEKLNIDYLINMEKQDNGFIWIEELVNELESYDKQRDKYPTLDSYMPKIVEAYDSWVNKIQQVENNRPKVVSIVEFTNGSTAVSFDIKTITINFNMPLSGQGYSVNYGKRGQDAFPKLEKINYANNNKSVIMEVTLEKNKEYQFLLVGKNFKSVEGIGIEDYEVNFKTE